MFSVYRTDTAQAPLREVWEAAGDGLRRAILQASHEVDQRLFREPQLQGESRGDNARILFQAPLGVLFEVNAEKKLVTILRSWAFRTSADACGGWE
jgi:hypothetical protein